MLYVYATLLTLLNAVWLALTIVGLPGTWLIAATTALLAWWQWDQQMIGWPVLAVLFALAALGELLEFIAGVVGTKQFGGSNRGALGAMIGTLVGGVAAIFLIPVPVVGSLIGACLGAAMGAWAAELHGGRDWKQSLNSAAGAGVGRLGGTVAKLACGVLMWVLASVAAFWP